MHLSAIRKLAERASERNGDSLVLALASYGTILAAIVDGDSEAWSKLELACDY